MVQRHPTSEEEHSTKIQKATINQLMRASIFSIIGIFSIQMVSSPHIFVRGISLLPLLLFSAFLGANIREYFVQKKITEKSIFKKREQTKTNFGRPLFR